MAIYGNGFVGNMVRSILKGFDKTHSTDQVTTTEGKSPVYNYIYSHKNIFCKNILNEREKFLKRKM